MKREPEGSLFYSRCGGFTVAELVAVLIIVGVLAAVAAPRLSGIGASLDEARLHDQTLAALRFAQKAAVTMQRYVCMTFTGGTQLALTYSSAYSPLTPPDCDTNLMPPAGGGQYTVVAQGAAGYTGQANFYYDRIGRPGIVVPPATPIVVPIVITVSAGRQITIEPESGYVR